MQIKDICECKVETASKDTSLTEAAKLMKEQNVGTLVVVETEGEETKPIGIITDRDIVVNAIAEESDLTKQQVEQCMSTDLLILKSDQDSFEALDSMSERGVRRAPIVDENDQLVGIATFDDIFLAIANEANKLAGLIRQQVHSAKS